MHFVVSQPVLFTERRAKPRPATIHQRCADGSYLIRLTGGRTRRAEAFQLAPAEPRQQEAAQ